ncbi:MFS-type transporter SLC18B1-like [Glandiceps talaboti]
MLGHEEYIFMCVLCYRFLDRLEKGTEFVAYCFLVRGVEALGASASYTSSYAIMAKDFPDNLATVVGISEIFTGLGFMIGPPLGGYLYQVSGYTVPFASLGTFTLIIAGLNIFILPNQSGNAITESGSLLKYLMMPASWLTVICVLTQGMAYSFLDPVLAKHLNKFHLGSALVGVIFLVSCASYTFSAFVFGWLSDKKDVSKLLMIIGNIGCGASFLYLGPCPLFNIDNNFGVIIFALVLFGLSCACTLIPTYQDLLTTATWYGMPDNLATYGVVSGVYSSVYSLGSFIGPTVGSALEEATNFSWASSVFSLFYFVLAFMFIIACLWEYQCGKG